MPHVTLCGQLKSLPVNNHCAVAEHCSRYFPYFSQFFFLNEGEVMMEWCFMVYLCNISNQQKAFHSFKFLFSDIFLLSELIYMHTCLNKKQVFVCADISGCSPKKERHCDPPCVQPAPDHVHTCAQCTTVFFHKVTGHVASSFNRILTLINRILTLIHPCFSSPGS